MSLARIEEIVRRTNALGADLILLGGDFVAAHRFLIRGYEAKEWAEILSDLSAPLGVYSVLGNHDWWHGPAPGLRPDGARGVQRALDNVGIPVLENDAIPIETNGRRFWLLGLGDQLAIMRAPHIFEGRDDLPATLAKVSDDSPVILLAHEPDIFANQPDDRIALTLSGHTHGGQVRLFGWSPVVPSQFGNRYAYGHVVEDGRHLIVSGGLGTSVLPVRLGVPPEIVLIQLGQRRAVA
jgi:uncharacterized protein